MAAKRRKTVCVRKRRKKVIQDYGPAKTVTVCTKRVPVNSAAGRKALKKSKRFCVYKGKKKSPESCHLKKSSANKAASRLKKRCKSSVRVKKAA